MTKTPSSLSAIEALAVAQGIRLSDVNDDAALPPGKDANVDFTVRFVGKVTRGKGSSRAGTNRARTAQAMVMLLVSSGATREHSPAKLIEAWKSFGTLDKDGMKARVAGLDTKDRALFDDCMALFQNEIVDSLPRIPSKGGVKFDGEVEKV
jgi:hypothetical protein|tara:strand:- start:21595 stop:22047 length:453 start_codon:yes stop_codon:yes gene_type:complete